VPKGSSAEHEKTSFNWLKFKAQRLRNALKESVSDMTFWRNYVVSPFTEEFVFRSCMLPLLVHQLGFTKAILAGPLFFGVAHLHHIVEGYFADELPLDLLVVQHCFQFAYTYLFGVYSSFLFLRTGDFFPCLVCHSFCNFMGFPNFRQLAHGFGARVKCALILVYVVGLGAFAATVGPLTEPSDFNNQVFIWY
jgi:prenyl protein peptidase